MAAAEVDSRPMIEEPAPAVPDYLASPNAVFDDKDAQWRYGHPPDYSKTRAVWEETKTMSHAAGSLPQLVENLVKNWEVEASFKPRLEDWRTIDHANYTFAINGGPPQTAEHMLKVGTYNAIVAPNEYYSPEHSDFAASHKTFKRMMPTFAWEVLEVYSGPPKVAFRWRHWGEMKSDYVGFNNMGEKITAKAHGGKIDIEGVTVAEVDDKVRLRKVETWFDPMEMFRQIAPKGVVNKEIVNTKVPIHEPPNDVPVNDGIKIANDHNNPDSEHTADLAPDVAVPKEISPSTGLPADHFVPNQGTSILTEKEKVDPASFEKELHPEVGTSHSQPHIADDGISLPQPIEGGKETSHSQSDQVDNGSSHLQPHEAGNRPSHSQSDQVDNGPSHLQPHEAGNNLQGEQLNLNDSRADSGSSDKTWEKVDRPKEGSSTTTQPGPLEQISDFVERIRIGMTGHIDAEHSTSNQAKIKSMETAVQPSAGEAVVAPAQSEETRMTHEEMSNISPMECPFLMNRE